MKRILALILILMLLLTTSCKNDNTNVEIDHNVDQSTNTEIPNVSPSDPDADAKEEHTHTYEVVVTKPTCEAGGYSTYNCTTCDYSYVADEVGPKGHTAQVIAGKGATCTSTGLTDGSICAVCEKILVNQTEISKTNHSYKTSTIVSSCTNSGYTTYTCVYCNYSYVDGEVSASGHTVEVIPGKVATCTSTGLTDGAKCATCGIIITNQTEIPALSHSYKTTTVSATCTSAGYTTYSCSNCSHSYTSNEVAAKGHEYSEQVIAPTCTTQGYTSYSCKNCDYSYTDSVVDAIGHIPGDAATCTSAQKCTGCGATIVIALGHNWVDATTEAPKTCTTCGLTEGEKLPSSSTPTTASTLYVNYINVGQGDSILIKVDDCDILIDAGTASYGSTVSSYLRNKGVDDIELMINTHPDADHCGGLTQVLKDYAVEEVWISKNTEKSTSAYNNFKSAVSSEGLSAKKPNAGITYTYDNLTLTVLYSEAVSGDTNNSSIVCMLEYGSFRFLFMGDIGETVEKKLVSANIDLKCDVLKVGHHGSAGSSTSSFLNATGAEYGVICVGSNSYGHPTSQALGRLSSAGVSVYRTDTNGNVVFSTNGVTLILPNGSTDSTGSGSGTITGGSSSGGTSSGGSSSGSSSGSTSSTQYFIGNTESKVFHLPTCSNLPASSKQNVMYNYYWIINIAGYTPCGRCLKDYSPSGGSSSAVIYILNTETGKYHLSTCSYLPAASKQQIIYSTYGYSPCGHCIK